GRPRRGACLVSRRRLDDRSDRGAGALARPHRAAPAAHARRADRSRRRARSPGTPRKGGPIMNVRTPMSAGVMFRPVPAAHAVAAFSLEVLAADPEAPATTPRSIERDTA